jgi:Tol biopolymer transport system component
MRVNSRFPLVSLGNAALVLSALAAAPPVASGQELPLQLYWVDRTGKAIEPVGPAGSYRGPDVTPDGRVAVHQHDRLGGDIWLFDTKGRMTRFTTDTTGRQENSSPIFSPDGTRIVFASLRNGKWGLYLKGVSSGREELLYESGSRKMPMAWSPDGQFIIFWVAGGAGQWVMPVKNPSAARPLHDRPNSHAQISPDGKWVAFNSLNQIYVKPFPTGEGLWKVSTDTGAFARWRGDSKELYFLSRVIFGQMMAVEISATGSTLQPSKPRALFDSQYVNLGHPSNYHTYSVASDGQRFLIPRIAPYSLTVFDRTGKSLRTLDRGTFFAPAWSPDGTRVAVVKDSREVWVIDASTSKSIQLVANQPEDLVTGLVWSPDGRQLAYHLRKVDSETIYRVAADGSGREEVVFKLPGFGLSLTDWSPDGRYLIYYSQQLAGNRLFALPVTPDPKPIEIMRADLPINGARISPDGRLIAYQSTETADSPKQGIYVRTLDLAAGKTGETAQQVKGDPSFGMGLGVSWRQDARELYYLAPKHGVMAVDVTASPALELGTPRLLFNVPDNTNDAQGLPFSWGNIARDGQRIVYSVAPKGASAPGDPISQLALLDRQGKVLRRVGPAGRYGQPALSPDGTRIATRWFDTFAPGGRSDIWVVDVASGKTTPITNDAPADFAPMWSPDGKQIFYVSARAGGYQGIYRKAADGTGDAELIYRYEPGAPVNLRDISADGKHLLFNSGGVILVVPMVGDATTRKAIELSREEFLVNGGVLSPDGKLIAFTSNETEAFELYLRPFDPATGAAVGDAKHRVSKDGAGPLMVWRSDGRELYFMDTEPDLKVMAVDVSTSPSVQTGAPRVLFDVPGDAQGDLGTTRYISRDGQRFVFVLPAESAAATTR